MVDRNSTIDVSPIGHGVGHPPLEEQRRWADDLQQLLRGLGAPSPRRGAAPAATCDASTQTQSVVFADSAECSSPMRPGAPTMPSCRNSWDRNDDAAQAEAIRTLQMLSQRDKQPIDQDRVEVLQAELRAERQSCRGLDEQLAQAKINKEAAKQQVLCLEDELDGKEAALQVAQLALDQREEDLKLVRGRLMSLEAASSAMAPTCDELRARLLERERQLALKDQHISRLLGILAASHRRLGGGEEDKSTACGSSDCSLNMSIATSPLS